MSKRKDMELMELSDHERQLVIAYRNTELSFKIAVDKILGTFPQVEPLKRKTTDKP